MENVILALAAVALLAVQTHRNYLMVQAAKRATTERTVNVEITAEAINYDALARAMEASWPTVNVSNEIEGIDYDKLGNAIKKALIESEVAVHNAFVPSYEPAPYFPATNEVIYEDGHATEVNTVTTLEINGTPVRRFPNRT